jgi:hypothetical protein
MDAKLRADALRGLISKLKGGKLPFEDGLEDKLETQSLPGRLHLNDPNQSYDSEDDPEERHRRRSFPLSPKAEKHMKGPHNRLFPGDVLERLKTPNKMREFPDNVYADSAPPNPLGRKGKSFATGETQTFTSGGPIGF